MSDECSARCKACDREFYPRWRSEVRQYEDLCFVCLPSALRSDEGDTDNRFIEGWLMDKEEEHGHY